MDQKRMYDERTMIEFEVEMERRESEQLKGMLETFDRDAWKETAEKLVVIFENAAAVAKAVIEKFNEIMQKVTPEIIEMYEQNKYKDKNYFCSIEHTKGRVFKSQVQNNKPRFAKARSNL